MKKTRRVVISKYVKNGAVWFLCLIAYQISLVIQCQNYPRTLVVLFNPQLSGFILFPMGICPKVDAKP